MSVLRLVRSLGGAPGAIFLVGCEPADLGEEMDGKMGLSDPVKTALTVAVERVASLVQELLDGARTIEDNPVRWSAQQAT